MPQFDYLPPQLGADRSSTDQALEPVGAFPLGYSSLEDLWAVNPIHDTPQLPLSPSLHALKFSIAFRC